MKAGAWRLELESVFSVGSLPGEGATGELLVTKGSQRGTDRPVDALFFRAGVKHADSPSTSACQAPGGGESAFMA